MKILVRFVAQLKQAAGQASEQLSVPPGCTVAQLLADLAQRRPALGKLLLDGDRPQRTLLIFVDDEQVSVGCVLNEGDEVLLMTPIAGGGCVPCRNTGN